MTLEDVGPDNWRHLHGARGRVRHATPDWTALQASIAGNVVRPGSTAYDELPHTFNARFHDVVPMAVVRCATPEDVRETLTFIHRHGLASATRAGGHCFAGRSSTRGVVIDVSPMRSVSVSGDVVTVGAGATSGEVYEALQEHGLAIPAGTCPTVGVAGVTLGGGLGILGRTHGVTSDHLLAAQIVVADGRVLDVDDDHQQDLFWALRGAGAGNFGVVTSLILGTVPAPDVTNVHLSWPFSHAAEVIEAWQVWAPDAPDELAASLKLTEPGGDDPAPVVDVYAAFQGTESEAANLLDQLVVRAGSDPTSSSSRAMSFAETRAFWADLGAEEGGGGPEASLEHPNLVEKSEFFRRHLPSGVIAALLATFSESWTPGQFRELDFMPWGGAYNRVRPDATAFVHRSERVLLKHAAVVDPTANADQKEAAMAWATRSWARVHPWGSGRVFPNFADPDIEDWTAAAYGTNANRLSRVKATYDPAGLFGFY
jgi:FAD binding domain/Berberine and berberine like